MNQLLSVGSNMAVSGSGGAVRIESFIGAGGQGEVYRAVAGGQPCALKWYHDTRATHEQRARLERIAATAAPSEAFLWPLEVVTSPSRPGYGYLMKLRPPEYRSLLDLMARKVAVEFDTRLTIGLEVVNAFLQLHARGQCYRDISFGNIFFDADGHVLVCDNDNVGFDGDPCTAVDGTPRFMAPEIVVGTARPSTATDLFSLAVLLFYLLHMAHPLDGAREAAIHAYNPAAQRHLYGEAPVFIFDPVDDSNRPVPAYHGNALAYWPIYPEALRDLFTRAFTDGLRDPSARVREGEWRTALSKARDLVARCPSCGVTMFADPTAAPGSVSCWSCCAAMPPVMWLELPAGAVVLRRDTRLFPHHVDATRRYDFSAPVAEISVNPIDPGRVGLRNLGGTRWSATAADGTKLEVVPGRSVGILPDMHLDFGPCAGAVRRSS